MKKAKLRPVGHITLELETLLLELAETHELQVHEIIALVHAYLVAHCPGSIEEYTDGSRALLYYGHQSGRPK